MEIYSASQSFLSKDRIYMVKAWTSCSLLTLQRQTEDITLQSNMRETFSVEIRKKNINTLFTTVSKPS